MRLNLKQLRRTGRTVIGKALTVALTASLALPPTFGVAAELERHNPKRGGVNTDSTHSVHWLTLLQTALPLVPTFAKLAFFALQDPIGGGDGGTGGVGADGGAITIGEAKPILFPPAPLGSGTPYPWQGAFPVPYGVVNPANGNLMLMFTLTGWSGKGPNVAFTLFYNSQDTRTTVLGAGWRHSFLASVQEAGTTTWLGTTYRLVHLHEPDGRLRVYYWKGNTISGAGDPMRGVNDVLEKLDDGRYWLTRRNQMKWYFDAIIGGVLL